jgi:hypothetical protein
MPTPAELSIIPPSSTPVTITAASIVVGVSAFTRLIGIKKAFITKIAAISHVNTGL